MREHNQLELPDNWEQLAKYERGIGDQNLNTKTKEQEMNYLTGNIRVNEPCSKINVSIIRWTQLLVKYETNIVHLFSATQVVSKSVVILKLKKPYG